MSGYTCLETRFMDLWDQGYSIEKIARWLRISRDQARRVLCQYYDNGDRTRNERAMIAGSAKLLAAMNQARMAA